MEVQDNNFIIIIYYYNYIIIILSRRSMTIYMVRGCSLKEGLGKLRMTSTQHPI